MLCRIIQILFFSTTHAQSDASVVTNDSCANKCGCLCGSYCTIYAELTCNMTLNGDSMVRSKRVGGIERVYGLKNSIRGNTYPRDLCISRYLNRNSSRHVFLVMCYKDTYNSCVQAVFVYELKVVTLDSVRQWSCC